MSAFSEELLVINGFWGKSGVPMGKLPMTQKTTLYLFPYKQLSLSLKNNKGSGWGPVGKKGVIKNVEVS